MPNSKVDPLIRGMGEFHHQIGATWGFVHGGGGILTAGPFRSEAPDVFFETGHLQAIFVNLITEKCLFLVFATALFGLFFPISLHCITSVYF